MYKLSIEFAQFCVTNPSTAITWLALSLLALAAYKTVSLIFTVDQQTASMSDKK